MKTWILIIFQLILVSAAYADVERVTLFNEQSFLFDGKNVTLIDSNDDSIIVCVNGEKAIISDGKTVNGLVVDRTDSNEGSSKLRLDFECRDDCSCDGDECNNNACFTTRTASSIESSSSVNIAENVESTISNTSNIGKITGSAVFGSSNPNSAFKIMTYALIGVAIVLGIAAYSMRRKKDRSLEEFEEEFGNY